MKDVCSRSWSLVASGDSITGQFSNVEAEQVSVRFKHQSSIILSSLWASHIFHNHPLVLRLSVSLDSSMLHSML